MKIIQLLVSTDGVHICIYAISRLNLILGKRQSLPLSRMNHLSLGFAQILDRETYRALTPFRSSLIPRPFNTKSGAVTRRRRRLGAQVLLEEFFYHFNTHFGLAHIQQRLVPFRFIKLLIFISYLVFALQSAEIIINLQAFFRIFSQNEVAFLSFLVAFCRTICKYTLYI